MSASPTSSPSSPTGGRVRKRRQWTCSNHHTPDLHRPGVFASHDGNCTVGATDLLALLANWGPCKGCPADFDNSGDVGVKDLLFLLGAWGPCPPKGDCPADFDLTGAVDVKDLLFLLGAWGPCP